MGKIKEKLEQIHEEVTMEREKGKGNYHFFGILIEGVGDKGANCQIMFNGDAHAIANAINISADSEEGVRRMIAHLITERMFNNESKKGSTEPQSQEKIISCSDPQ